MKTIALVGRPNVGKSRIFNRLVGRRHSIVEGTPGITRDRVELVIDWDGAPVRIIDTGGIGSEDSLRDQIHLQVEVAISAADLVLFVVDVRDGLLPPDRDIADKLRVIKNVIVVANKADDKRSAEGWTEFTKLGFGAIIPVSAEHGRAWNDLTDVIREKLGVMDATAEESPVIKLAIVGRPNVGKSSLLNALIGSERAIVSAQPGTTRDMIDAVIDIPAGRIGLTDTAGIRKRRRDYDLLESIMVHRTADAVAGSNVALVLVDAVEGLTDQDLKILNAVFAQGRGVVIGLNKWDAVEDKAFDRVVADMRRKMGSEAHVPIVSISALKKLRLDRLLEQALEVGENLSRQIPTAEFNRVLADAARRAPKGIRIKYGIQKTINPPTFLLFGSEKLPKSFQQYIRNSIRGVGGFDGVPIVMEFRR